MFPITKTRPCNFNTWIFHDCKNDNFQLKFFDYLHICAQNIDRGYTLEPPQFRSSGKSVVDYILVNPSLFDNFSIFEVGEPNILSDHCAIHFCLKLKEKMQTGNIRNTDCNSNVNKKYEWKGEKAGQYEYNLFLEDEKFDELNVELQQARLLHLNR